MGLIPNVKCARCDRKYSGGRSRCPYCGARRIGRGKFSEEPDTSRGKMLIGILIMAVLVVAVGVLLFTAPTTPPYQEPENGVRDPSPGIPAGLDDSGNVTVSSNYTIDPTDSPGDDAGDDEEPVDETPPVEIEYLEITYTNRKTTDFSVKVGERVPLRVRIEPPGSADSNNIEWKSSDDEIFQVVSMDGISATVTGIGIGQATLTVIVEGKEETCIVRGTRP